MTHSIRFKFILFITAILLVLILLLNLYPVASSRGTMFQEKRSSLTSQASAVSAALAGPVPLEKEEVSRIIGALDLGNFDRVTVLDAEGRTVYDDGEGAFDPEDLETALHGETAFQTALTRTDFVSSIAVPVSAPDGLRGAVALYENDRDLARLLLTVRERIAVLSLMIGGLVLLLALTFSWVVLRRLNDLTRSMSVVAGGDYAYRHEVKGNDEISELGREFNALTEKLEANEAQRRRFVSDASHELKTPLASIRLLSDSILQTEDMAPERSGSLSRTSAPRATACSARRKSFWCSRAWTTTSRRSPSRSISSRSPWTRSRPSRRWPATAASASTRVWTTAAS